MQIMIMLTMKLLYMICTIRSEIKFRADTAEIIVKIPLQIFMIKFCTWMNIQSCHVHGEGT